MKKAILIVGSAIGLFLIGWLFGEIGSTETWSEVLSFQQEIELQRESEKAFKAYVEEKEEIGIYSLTELLEEIRHRQELIGTEENKSSFTYYKILTHTRLSKLFEVVGDEKKSEFHRLRAREVSNEGGGFEVLFTEMTFDERIEYFDSKETGENKTIEGQPIQPPRD